MVADEVVHRCFTVDTAPLHLLLDCYTSCGIERHTTCSPVPWLAGVARLSRSRVVLDIHSPQEERDERLKWNSLHHHGPIFGMPRA